MRLDLATAPAYQAPVARSGQVVLAFGLPAGLLSAVLAVAWLSSSTSTDGLGPMRFLPFSPRSASGPPPPSPDQTLPPTTLEQVSPAQAELRNALIPYSRAPLLTAARYIPNSNGESVEAALPCLTRAIYYEAAREPVAGQHAVAQVIINRWASAPFPKTICGVVEQGAPRLGCQFTFECDGSLAKRPDPTLLLEAEAVARATLNGYVASEIGAATHYHADYVVPVWGHYHAQAHQDRSPHLLSLARSAAPEFASDRTRSPSAAGCAFRRTRRELQRKLTSERQPASGSR